MLVDTNFRNVSHKNKDGQLLPCAAKPREFPEFAVMNTPKTQSPENSSTFCLFISSFGSDALLKIQINHK